MGLRATFARVEAFGERFAIDLGGGDDDADVALAALVGSVELIEQQITAAGVRLGTTDRRVAASILFQGTVGRVAAGVLAAAIVERRAPTIALDAIRLRFEEGRCVGVRIVDADVLALRGDPAASRACAQASAESLLERVAAELLSEVIVPLRDAVRAVAGNSPLQLRGNAAAALAGILVRLQRAGVPTALPDRQVIVGAAPELFERTGSFETLACAEREWSFFTRRTCCQMHRIEGSSPCGTCPLRDAEEQTVRWRRVISEQLRQSGALR